ncbi:hypothetical protein N7467_001558 [Penicillium canescens]|nr:hypothetical protein N7467_001558 [Penicillium canescens]
MPTERIEEHFHRLLISMGYAAQRMPSLKILRFEIQSENEFILYFRNTADEITLGWECYPEYQPDELEITYLPVLVVDLVDFGLVLRRVVASWT